MARRSLPFISTDLTFTDACNRVHYALYNRAYFAGLILVVFENHKNWTPRKIPLHDTLPVSLLALFSQEYLVSSGAFDADSVYKVQYCIVKIGGPYN